MSIGQAGQNESEPHRMSVEKCSTGEPSPCVWGEGCQGPSKNRGKAVHRSGGVSAAGMSGSVAGVNQEISSGAGPQGRATAGASPQGEAERAGGEVGGSRSSVEAQDSTTCAEPRGATCAQADWSGAEQGDGWTDLLSEWGRIITPAKVQKLQRTLYRKAKAEPGYRFYSLYGEVCRMDVLETALAQVTRNGGCAGVDGVKLDTIQKDETSRNTWLKALAEELRTGRYRPEAVLRVEIPKGEGKTRPLGIPTVKDRVVQMAVLMVVLPIFEADMHRHSYAYRPGKSAHQALRAIAEAVKRGKYEIIDADLSGYFDSIPHGRLMKLVARRISDGSVLALISAWLKAPVEERDPKSGKRTRRRNERGTPQGGVISPLLANIYLNRLDWEVNERCRGKPEMIRYADDFVILAGTGQGKGLLERLKSWLEARGLSLNERKTRLVDIRQESIKFLGFSLSWRRRLRPEHYLHIEAHPKSQQKLRDKVRERLNHWTMVQEEGETVRSLNRLLKGWAGYFRFGNRSRVFSKMQYYVSRKVERWLRRRHGQKLARVEAQRLAQSYNLYRLA